MTNANSQTPGSENLIRKINALEKKKDYLTDSSYLNARLDLAFFYVDRNPDSALLISHKLIEQFKAVDFKNGEINCLIASGNAWQTKGDFDSSLYYYNEALYFSEKYKYNNLIRTSTGNIAIVYYNQGNYPLALEKFYTTLQLAEKAGDKSMILANQNNIGNIQFYQGKMNEAETSFIKTLEISRQLKDTDNIILSYNNIGEVNVEQKQINKAIGNLSLAYELARHRNTPALLAAVSNTLGDCYLRLDSIPEAQKYFASALEISRKSDLARATAKAEIGLAKINNKTGQYNVALVFGLDAISKAQKMGQAQLQRDALEEVANIYGNKGDGNNAFKYYKEYKIFSDSLVNVENERVASSLKADYQIAKKEAIFQKTSSQQRWWIFSAFAGLLSAIIILLLIYRNKKKLGITYRELQEKTKIIEEHKKETEKTLAELKSTQAQLVQNEKMASLGELTAGIAHEIQNPLNFVNNFSELNNELIDELKQENADLKKEELEELLNDIFKNNEKIKFHGARADAIVKGMLQHSRSNSGVKEPTDINALCEEFLRLSYHGLRAKDKNFNAAFKMDFDESIGKINIVPQDIGRVILNLVTNAFYAVQEKQKMALLSPEGGNEHLLNKYEPTVKIATRKISAAADGAAAIEILVSDNGNGIPKNIIDKIFQPFFTTKPTGEGTGLGLSLSYDIIKAHRGEIKVDTKENEGTSFTIKL